MSDAALKVTARRVTMAIRAPAVHRLTVMAPAPVRLTVKPRTTIRIGLPKQGPPGPAGKDGRDGVDGAASHNYPLSIAATGQAAFPMPVPPRSPADVVLFVNGVAYRPPIILLTAVLLTWAGPFDLSPDDVVSVVYA